MNRDQQPQPWWKDNWFVWAIAALTLTGLVIITILGYWQKWAWTELLWRWLELLIIPVVLALGVFWLNTQSRKRELEQEMARRKSEEELARQARESEQKLAQQERENDRAIAKERAREDALQRYLDRMSELVLDKHLRESKLDDANFRVSSMSLLPGDAVRATARARTFIVLRSLDGNRKGEVVRFLYEADLIGNAVLGERLEAVVNLQLADLRGANLGGANLRGANLGVANLSGANLRAVLMFANLTHAKMSDADLSYADLQYADLMGADMRDADLSNANLTNAKLWRVT